MILVNTTFLVESGLEGEWTVWAHTVYIPTAVSAGYRHPLLMRVFSQEDNGGTTYALQIQCDGMPEASDWLDKLQPVLLDEISRRWGQRVLHFTTMMEEVERD
ncbi:MAG: DUF4286 family protein [Muribaculum intestinale]|nr:DUF4286 family protein [Muribaculum intestinale]